MHHRRSRNPRREGKRLDNKAYRQAENRAMERGVSDNPPQDSWRYRPEPLPLGDVPCNGKTHGNKKKSKKRDRCPEGGAHEWYYEWLEEKDFKRDAVSDCHICVPERAKWIAQHERWKRDYGWDYSMWQCPYRPWWCTEHGTKKWFTRRKKIATCLKCWKQITKKVTDDYDELFPRTTNWRGRPFYLPKRQVKF